MPEPDLALEIDRWRNLCWRGLSGATTVQNLHVTLAFLGDISAERCEALESALDSVPVPEIALPLQRVGYQVDQAMLWLEPPADVNTKTGGLATLVADIRAASARVGVAVDRGQYRPHMTLARRLNSPATAPLLDPDFVLVTDRFHLVESRLTPNGPVYRTRRSWPAFNRDSNFAESAKN